METETWKDIAIAIGFLAAAFLTGVIRYETVEVQGGEVPSYYTVYPRF